jgi:ubiquinone/menaquinone biosynthesis C-methylase UbiE
MYQMKDSGIHERRFQGEADRLRSAERIALLEVDRVVAVSMEGLKAVRSMLDVGTGTGVFAEEFSKLVRLVMGIDTNIQLLAIARNYIPEARFQEAEAEHIPFANHSFDLVFLSHLLHETDNPLQALEEARRVARSRVVLLEWPYLEEEQGPPVVHRLRPEVIEDLAGKAHYRKVERIRLTHMDLYRLMP